MSDEAVDPGDHDLESFDPDEDGDLVPGDDVKVSVGELEGDDLPPEVDGDDDLSDVTPED